MVTNRTQRQADVRQDTLRRALAFSALLMLTKPRHALALEVNNLQGAGCSLGRLLKSELDGLSKHAAAVELTSVQDNTCQSKTHNSKLNILNKRYKL